MKSVKGNRNMNNFKPLNQLSNLGCLIFWEVCILWTKYPKLDIQGKLNLSIWILLGLLSCFTIYLYPSSIIINCTCFRKILASFNVKCKCNWVLTASGNQLCVFSFNLVVLTQYSFNQLYNFASNVLHSPQIKKRVKGRRWKYKYNYHVKR